MGSEVPSAVLFSEGRSPEENSRQWEEPKAHRFNWCLEKRNDIFVLYPSSTTFMESSSYFHVFMLVTFLLKVPRNPTNFAFICTQVGLILDIFLFFVCKKHYFEK